MRHDVSELETHLGMRSCPMNWPIFDGYRFVGVYERSLVFEVSNWISTAAANALRPRLRELIEGDAQEMLLQRVEENAANPEAGVSGLGFLTMITDYDAQLGWRLRAPEGEGERLQFHTMARLPIFRT